MKYSDIPKFTRNASYQVDMDLDTLPCWIERQMKQGINLDPDFQRDHVWTDEQRIAYMEFLISGGYTGKDIYFNMPGWQGDYKGDFVLVDGKQRLNSILKFINNEIPVFGTYIDEFEDKDFVLMQTSIKIHVNNLKTRKEVLQWYVQFNKGGTVHTKEEIDKVIEMMEQEK